MSVQIQISWDELKVWAQGFNLPITYAVLSTGYAVAATNGQIDAVVTLIFGQASTVDFEANFKAAANEVETMRPRVVELSDGQHTATIKAGGIGASMLDSAVVTTLSPNTPLPAGNNVIGHVVVDGSSSITTVEQPDGANLHVDVDNFPSFVVVTGPLTDAELRSSPVPVSGVVTVQQSSGLSLHVDVDNFPATQPVSGPLTDAQLRAVTVPVNASGHDVTVVQPAGSSLHVDVDNFPATQPISVASLPLPTGAATSTNQTNGAQQTQMVQGGNIATIDATGDVQVDVNNFPAVQPISAASLPLPSGASTSAKQPAIGVPGIASADVLTVQGVASMVPLKIDGTATTQPVSGPLTDAQLRATTVPVSSSQGSPNILGNAWPVEMTDGTSILGTTAHPVRIDTTGVTTQPISVAALPLPAGAASSANQTNGAQQTQIIQGGNVASIDATGDLQVDVNNFPVTQGIAGTVTSIQGTPNSVANSWPVEVTDGTNVLGTVAHPIRVDTTGSTIQPISAASLPLPTGAATSAKQPALGTAGVASSDVMTVQGVASMLALKIDGSAVTQPISATTLPLPTGASTSANQTNGSQQTQIIQGGNVAIVDATGDQQVDVNNFPATQTVNQASGANLHVNVDVLPSVNQGTANSVANAWPVKVTDGVNVLGTSVQPIRIDPTGTTSQPVTQTTNPWLTSDAADVTTGASVPAKAGYMAGRGTTALPTAVLDGQAVAPMMDKFGRLVVIQNTVRGLTGLQVTAVVNTAETTIITAGAVGVFNDIIMLSLDASAAVTVTIRDTTGGAARMVFHLNNGVAPTIIAFETPAEQTTAASNWTLQSSANGTVNVNVQFVKNK